MMLGLPSISQSYGLQFLPDTLMSDYWEGTNEVDNGFFW